MEEGCVRKSAVSVHVHSYTRTRSTISDYGTLSVVMGMIRPQRSIKDLRIRPLVRHTDTKEGRICRQLTAHMLSIISYVSSRERVRTEVLNSRRRTNFSSPSPRYTYFSAVPPPLAGGAHVDSRSSMVINAITFRWFRATALPRLK